VVLELAEVQVTVPKEPAAVEVKLTLPGVGVMPIPVHASVPVTVNADSEPAS
jgi:hypothetical protein